jgi:hypothetical protein
MCADDELLAVLAGGVLALAAIAVALPALKKMLKKKNK